MVVPTYSLAMSSAQSLGGNYWGTLIRPDKSPAPLLELLCLGIAQFMVSTYRCFLWMEVSAF